MTQFQPMRVSPGTFGTDGEVFQVHWDLYRKWGLCQTEAGLSEVVRGCLLLCRSSTGTPHHTHLVLYSIWLLWYHDGTKRHDKRFPGPQSLNCLPRGAVQVTFARAAGNNCASLDELGKGMSTGGIGQRLKLTMTKGQCSWMGVEIKRKS